MSNLSAWSNECKSGTYFRRAPHRENHTISQNIGVLLCCPFAPYVTDGFGRRTAVFLGAIIQCGAVVLQAASTSVNMFIGARCVPRRAYKIINTEHPFYTKHFTRIWTKFLRVGVATSGHGACIPISACPVHVCVQLNLVSTYENNHSLSRSL
jgi:hypothetical protein